MPSGARSSRFIEGEPLTCSPSSSPNSNNSLFSTILTEMDQHESRRRFRQDSSSSSTGSAPATTSTSPSSPISSRDHHNDHSSATGSGHQGSDFARLRQLVEADRERDAILKEKRSDRFKGRLRGLTGGLTEKKGQDDKVTP